MAGTRKAPVLRVLPSQQVLDALVDGLVDLELLFVAQLGPLSPNGPDRDHQRPNSRNRPKSNGPPRSTPPRRRSVTSSDRANGSEDHDTRLPSCLSANSETITHFECTPRTAERTSKIHPPRELPGE